MITRRTGAVFHEALRLIRDEDVDPWRDLDRRAAELSTPSRAVYAVAALSAIVAACGLRADGAAAVMAAALVAPGAGPVVAIAFALGMDDAELLGRATVALLTLVLLTVLLGVAVGLMPDGVRMGAEILGRTRVRTYDILIALGVGLAGAYALTERHVSAALPAAAMALVILPPLSVVGLCLATNRAGDAARAFALFGTDVAALVVGGIGVFTWFGYRHGHVRVPHGLWPFLRRFGATLALLAGVAACLGRTLVTEHAERRQRDAVLALLDPYVRAVPGMRVASLSITRRDDSLRVSVGIFGPRVIQPPEVAAMEARLHSVVDPGASLTVRSVLGTVYTAGDSALLPMMY